MNIVIAIYFIKTLKRIYKNDENKYFSGKIESTEKENNSQKEEIQEEIIYQKNTENETPVQEGVAKSVIRERHAFTTIYLYFLLASNIYFGINNLLIGTSFLFDNSIIMYVIMNIILTIVAILGIIFLLKWKKHGFWIYIISKILGVLVSIIIPFRFGTNIAAFLNIVGATLLWAVLSFKKNEKTVWEQLTGK
jgi:hypothetical protein